MNIRNNTLSAPCRLQVAGMVCIAWLVSSAFSGFAFGQDVDAPTDSAGAILQRIADAAWPADEPMRVEYELHRGLHRGLSRSEPVGFEEIERSNRKRVILERFANGAIRELSWHLNESGEPSVFPYSEWFYDGKRGLRVDGPRFSNGDENGKISLMLYPNPSFAHAMGMRGDAILVHTGHTPLYTEESWNLFEIVGSAHVRVTGSTATKVILESESEMASIRIEADPDSGRLKRVTLRLDQPSHVFHGWQLEETQVERWIGEYFDFEYAAPNLANVHGLQRYKCYTTLEQSSGARAQTADSIEILRFEHFHHPPFSLDEQIPFTNEVPDGTRVGVMGPGNDVFYLIRDNRIEAPD